MVGIFGAVWFFLLFFAGFTSAIAMYNYLVALLEEDLGIHRKKGALDQYSLDINSWYSSCFRASINKNSNLFYLQKLITG